VPLDHAAALTHGLYRCSDLHLLLYLVLALVDTKKHGFRRG
jgi:hypothetical protein